MGLASNWTQAEKDQLAEEWGTYSTGTIAKHLNRSEEGIVIMARKLNLGAHLDNSTMVSLSALFNELGWNGSYTERYKRLKAAGLKIHMQRVRECSFRMVDIDEFWEFAEKNKFLFDFSRLEENALGVEPDWVKFKRAEDYKRTQTVRPHNTPWTESEDSQLLSLLRAYRYTYPEIAAKLHRTEGAIQRRVIDLGIKDRPLKADNHTLWTEEQFQILGRMIKAGSSYESMSRVIGKSAKAIRGKVYTMYLTENLDKVSRIMGDGQWGDNRPDRTLSQYKLMTIEEKEKTKEALSCLAGLLASQVRKHFNDQDNWQRNLCRHWDEVKGCTMGGVNCDDCDDFIRIRPQYCVRCGATFYERQENRVCERCRTQRKKSAARKYMQLKNIQARRKNNGI